MKIVPDVARTAMKKNLISEERIAKELGLKLKSARSILSGTAPTSDNQGIKLCSLLKVEFSDLEARPVDIGGE